MEQSIPEAVSNDKNDYFKELINLLSRTQRTKPDDFAEDETSQLTGLSDTDRERLILHSWLALSIVQKEEGDAAAVATYRKHDKIIVYYAKNCEIEDECASHINVLLLLVRNSARNPVSKDQFVRSYFGLVHRNLYAKFRRRVNGLKYFVAMQNESDRPELLYHAPTPRLLSYLNQNLSAKTPFTIKLAADECAAALSPSQNLYDGLISILTTLRDRIGSVNTERDFEFASFYALGHSTLINNITPNRREVLDLVESSRKLGEYWRGVSRLFRLINAQREVFQNFEVVPISNTMSRVIPVKKDWYHVLSCFYLRETGQLLPFPESKFEGLFTGVRNYVKYCQNTQFDAHCEVVLVAKLMELGQVPSAIGISRAACPMCHRFIRGLNRHLKDEGHGNWIIGGENKTIYPWKELPTGNNDALKRGNEEVRRFVCNRIHNLINRCMALSDCTQSPALGFPVTSRRASRCDEMVKGREVMGIRYLFKGKAAIV